MYNTAKELCKDIQSSSENTRTIGPNVHHFESRNVTIIIVICISTKFKMADSFFYLDIAINKSFVTKHIFVYQKQIRM